LGVETFVGTSGRVFPDDLKAAPLLRRWVRRLRESGVAFHTNHRWLGWSDDGALRFAHGDGEVAVRADATLLALGGASWPKLGSDGSWVDVLRARGVGVAPLAPANCGFDIGWSGHFASRHAGAPVKPVVLAWRDDERSFERQGELVVTATGIEGSLVYAASALLRDAIAARGTTTLTLDLAPGRSLAVLEREIARQRDKRSLSSRLDRVGIRGVKAGLLYETTPREALADPATVAQRIKALPLTLVRARPVEEAISTAGGVTFAALDEKLMLRALPGVFCAGEMIDWEAPTGGYLLTASYASGVVAAEGAIAHLRA
ncbi:MAG TPA: TIGR03862 family flavoprotein, partial [Xanthomonadales bacterium]|nr:TIGR03862 family flavoprotein [Xanthomonadales bacterium]